MNRIRKTEPGMTAKRHMLSTYRHSAKTKNMPFELDNEAFFSLVTSNCFYCGSEPRRIKRENSIHGSAKLNGIDRVDNELGYTIANSVPCCYICNHAKRDMLLSDFLTWLEQIYSHQKAKT